MSKAMTTVELNKLLFQAIINVMTDEQMDGLVPAMGMTTRELLQKSAIYMAGCLPTEHIETKPSATTGRVKAYWHPHGYLCATKPNAEWQPLILEF